MPLAITLHVLSAVIWVGGMFFAYVALRPAAAGLLEPPLRAPLWSRTFGRFFPWVWGAVVLLPGTGYWMIFEVFQGLGNIGLHVHVMQVSGIAMILLYLFVFFLPYRRLNRAVAGNDFAAAVRHLALIRRLVGVNLVLGLLTVVVATGGAYWG
jgi:uncharacterized membrane protein